MRLVRTTALTSSCLGGRGLRDWTVIKAGGVGFDRSPHNEPPDIGTSYLSSLCSEHCLCWLTSGSVCNRLIVDSAHVQGSTAPPLSDLSE